MIRKIVDAARNLIINTNAGHIEETAPDDEPGGTNEISVTARGAVDGTHIALVGNRAIGVIELIPERQTCRRPLLVSVDVTSRVGDPGR